MLDPDKLTEIWDQHADRLLLIARSIGGPAEDAMQEAFVIRGPKARRCSSCRLSNDRVFVLPMLQLRVKDIFSALQFGSLVFRTCQIRNLIKDQGTLDVTKWNRR